MDPLLSYRERFPILQTTTYLINNSLGAMPGDVYQEMRSYAGIWAQRGVRAWGEAWWTLPVDVGDLVAPILGARPGTISMHTNVSTATAVVLSALTPTQAKNKVVTTALQFPSIQYVLEQWCLERDVTLEVVPADASGLGVDQQRLLEAIDDSTLAVSVSHAEFKSAYLNDAPAIARCCRAHDALLILDAFQSAGVVPIEVEQWGVDVCVGGCLKWLCGGPGNVYLYVDPEVAPRLQPRLTGWMAHPAPFAFENAPMRWRDDAYRFLAGTPQIACLYAASPGLKMHAEIGIPAIRAKSLLMTDALLDAAQARGWDVTAPLDRTVRGGTVAVNAPHGELVAKELNDRDVVVDFRPGAGIRIAPHFYNSVDECQFAITQIDEILQTKAYEKHTSVAGATPT